MSVTTCLLQKAAEHLTHNLLTSWLLQIRLQAQAITGRCDLSELEMGDVTVQVEISHLSSAHHAHGRASASKHGRKEDTTPVSDAKAPASIDRQGSIESEEDICTICFDAPAKCVLLECGHALCKRCAHLMFVRPPNECPHCRCNIEQVVELQQPACKVGEHVKVIN